MQATAVLICFSACFLFAVCHPIRSRAPKQYEKNMQTQVSFNVLYCHQQGAIGEIRLHLHDLYEM